MQTEKQKKAQEDEIIVFQKNRYKMQAYPFEKNNDTRA